MRTLTQMNNDDALNSLPSFRFAASLSSFLFTSLPPFLFFSLPSFLFSSLASSHFSYHNQVIYLSLCTADSQPCISQAESSLLLTALIRALLRRAGGSGVPRSSSALYRGFLYSCLTRVLNYSLSSKHHRIWSPSHLRSVAFWELLQIAENASIILLYWNQVRMVQLIISKTVPRKAKAMRWEDTVTVTTRYELFSLHARSLMSRPKCRVIVLWVGLK